MIRGDLWWADYGEPFGSEPGYRRPVIIFQIDYFNKSKINTLIVIPLTTNILMAEVPGNVFLEKNETKLRKDSVVLTLQIGVIDRQRLVERISRINKSTMEKIEESLAFILGIKKT